MSHILCAFTYVVINGVKCRCLCGNSEVNVNYFVKSVSLCFIIKMTYGKGKENC